MGDVWSILMKYETIHCKKKIERKLTIVHCAYPSSVSQRVKIINRIHATPFFTSITLYPRAWRSFSCLSRIWLFFLWFRLWENFKVYLSCVFKVSRVEATFTQQDYFPEKVRWRKLRRFFAPFSTFSTNQKVHPVFYSWKVLYLPSESRLEA